MKVIELLVGVCLILVLLTLWQINSKLDDLLYTRSALFAPNRDPSTFQRLLQTSIPVSSTASISPGVSLEQLGIQPVLIPFRPVAVPDYLRQRNYQHLNNVEASIEEQNKWAQFAAKCTRLRQYLYPTGETNKYEFRNCADVPVLSIWRDPVTLDWDYAFKS